MIRALELTGKLPAVYAEDFSAFYWEIAYISEYEMGDFELARKYFGKLVAEYPRDNRVFIAQKELRRMDRIEHALRQGKELPSASEIQREGGPQ
jgi:hypothetical protein